MTLYYLCTHNDIFVVTMMFLHAMKIFAVTMHELCTRNENLCSENLPNIATDNEMVVILGMLECIWQIFAWGGRQ